ncbi:monovalent cation/H+ antiporter complex subunit F [Streptomyces sp. XM4193]|uniref:Sodium:proton antiporter n=1 Tax=Streptomyces tardus TaxID=2780544 RepID=A0A949JFA7_9ACTN|nr:MULTISPECIES: monovalent cation/H+ antiporter complex subunit F [Streptomyces]MBU7597898.1 sodium:proton antiporter [Streptomyces tardus]MCK1794521.1 monovalent cation/H+ antiporter complex subunit F [Streptomyces sp. XM4193]
MTVVAIIALTILAVAALLVLIRLLRGPRVLDRINAVDVLVTQIVAGAAVAAAVWNYVTVLPVLLVLALLGFSGSVAAGRLVEEREDMR